MFALYRLITKTVIDDRQSMGVTTIALDESDTFPSILPRVSMRSWHSAILFYNFSPSVRLSIQYWYCAQTNAHIVKLL